MPYVTVVSKDGSVYHDVQCETPMTAAAAREFSERIIDCATDIETVDAQSVDNPVEEPDA